jgi:putative membrane protein
MKAAWIAVLGVALAGTAAAQSHTDKSFMETASQGNVAEVEMAKLALKKSQNPDVRAFAERMIKDHQTLGEKMAPFMAQAGLKPSISMNTMHQHIYNKLNGLSGAEFDKQYAEAMDKDHHEDLKDFRKEINDTQNAQLKPVVIEGEKVIEQHTQMADDLARKFGVPVAS